MGTLPSRHSVAAWVFQESMSAIKLVSIAMIVLGVVGLNMGDMLTRTAP